MKKLAIKVLASGRDVDMFNGRHSDLIGQVTKDAALRLIQARNDVHAEGGMFHINVEWHPEGWLDGVTNASVELHQAVKALLKAADEWESCKDLVCKTHFNALIEAIKEYRIKREIKNAEDAAMEKEAGGGKV